MASSFDSYRDSALMFGAGAGLSTGIYLSSFGYILAQLSRVFIIYGIYFFAAISTYLSLRYVFGSPPLLLGLTILVSFTLLKLPINIMLIYIILRIEIKMANLEAQYPRIHFRQVYLQKWLQGLSYQGR